MGPKTLDSFSFMYRANGKRLIKVENFSEQKMSRYKQLEAILVDEKLREPSYLCVEVLNSKRQLIGHVVKNSRWPIDVYVKLNSLFSFLQLGKSWTGNSLRVVLTDFFP